MRETIEREVNELDGGTRLDEARELFERVALGEHFVEFLTIPAYEHID